jgi:4-amino-4-deoxy-L-arabinose transferase-like glycosyltransferase
LSAESNKSVEIARAASNAGRLTKILSSPLTVFLSALLIRLLDLTLHPWFTAAHSDHMAFGYEIGRVAQSLVEGHGFSSPFAAETGPTAWYTPVYPLLVAAIFKIFGVYTPASAWVIAAVNSACAALTAVVMIAIGRETVGARAGIIAAWIWALLPYVMQWSVRWVWDTSLSALLVAMAAYATLRTARGARARDFILLGLLWAAIANTNPTLVSLLPFSVAWIWWKLRPRPSAKYGAVVVMVVTVLGCVPWMARNYVTMHYLGLRSNFGEELYLGNQEGSGGRLVIGKHPIWNSEELKEYERVGELAYIAQKRRLALEFIAGHPAEFAESTLKRVAYFWIGAGDDPRVHPSNLIAQRTLLVTISLLGIWGCSLAVRKKVPGAWLLVSTLIFYPLIFYITHTHVRYRHPLDPILFLGAVYLFVPHAEDRQKPPTESAT